MTKLRTNQSATMNYLNRHFEDYNDNVNLEYLNDSIEMVIDNTKWIYEKLVSNRRSPIHSVVWCGLMELCDRELRNEGYKCSSAHLKKWLASHGLDYKTCFNGLIERLTEEREEMLSEKEN